MMKGGSLAAGSKVVGYGAEHGLLTVYLQTLVQILACRSPPTSPSFVLRCPGSCTTRGTFFQYFGAGMDAVTWFNNRDSGPSFCVIRNFESRQI